MDLREFWSTYTTELRLSPKNILAMPSLDNQAFGGDYDVNSIPHEEWRAIKMAYFDPAETSTADQIGDGFIAGRRNPPTRAHILRFLEKVVTSRPPWMNPRAW